MALSTCCNSRESKIAARPRWFVLRPQLVLGRIVTGHRVPALILVVGCFVGVVVGAPARPKVVHTLYSPVQHAGDAFGLNVAAADGLIAVSNPNRDLPVPNAGSVHLIDASWRPVSQIQNPNLAPHNFFATALHIDANGVLVGNWYDDLGGSNSGAAYAYDRMGNLRLQLHSPSPAPEDRFGYAVSQVGDNLLVTAYKDDTLATDAGSAYLFDGATGELLHTWYDPTPAIADRFGHSAASWGKYAIVSCYRESEILPNSGAVYLFDSEDGSLVRTIYNPKPQHADLFGKAVAVRGDQLVVTAIGDKAGYSFEVGAAFVFDLNTGALLHELVNPNPLPESQFGEVVAWAGDNVLIGAPEVDVDGVSNAGTAYLFSGKTGRLLATLQNPDPTENDYYGRAVAGLGNLALVGSPFDDSNGLVDSGAVYAWSTRELEPSQAELAWLREPAWEGSASVPEPPTAWLAVAGTLLVASWPAIKCRVPHQCRGAARA